MNYNTKMYLILVVMLFASLLGCFFTKAEEMWYPLSHLVISAIGIVGLFLCEVFDKK